jgi:alkaline phosphatase D
VDRLSRRTFLALGATVVVGACTSDDAAPTSTTSTPSTTGPSPSPTTAPTNSTSETTTATTAGSTTTSASTTTSPPLAANPFALGVASGDPDDHSAVLWTRLVGPPRATLEDQVDVIWEVAADEEFGELTSSGTVPARAAEGHSVHVTVELDGPAWYRFRAGGWTSPVGRVAPTPDDSDEQTLRVAATNCQHFETGFYAAHRDAADWQPDLVMFLGDFIYENAPQPVGPDRVRSHEGDGEATDVAGYRARYAQYLSDPQLQASRAACPWLVIWDDHEVDNNYAGLVPENPADATGFAARRAAAYQVWWEHMPVRLPPPHGRRPYRINRRVRWGTVADMILLDGRQYRSDQACGDAVFDTDPPCPEAADPSRTMLGTQQEDWLGEAFASPTGTWTVLGQQTVLSDFRLPNGAILNYDQWDGYGPARERLLAQATRAERVVVLTGDIHLAAVGTLPGVGVEFVTASISSRNNIDPVLAPALTAFNDIVAAEIAHRGYIRHTITARDWTAEYRIVEDVLSADSPVSTWRSFRVDSNTRDRVVEV